MSCENCHTAFIENEFVTLRIQSRLLFVIFKPHVYLDLGAAHLIVADRLQLQEGRSYYVVCDVTGVSGAHKEALDHLSGVGSEQIKAIAFVTSSNLDHAKITLYLELHITPVPTKVCRTQDEAVEYLSSFLK